MDESPKKKGSVQPTSIESAVSNSWPALNNPYLKEEPERRTMGVPKEVQNLTFARKFRWTVEAEGLPEFLVKSVRVVHSPEFNKRGLFLELYEVYGCEEARQGQKWIDSFYEVSSIPKRQNIKVHSYDGCGTLLGTEEFRNIELKSESYDYDYESSEVVSRKLKFAYQNRVRTDAVTKEIRQSECVKEPKPPAPRWSIQLGYCGDENWKSATEEMILIDLPKRPNIDIDEVRLSFLNASTWVPGKAKWNDFKVVVDKEVASKIGNILNQSRESRLALYYYDKDGIRKETWYMTPIWLRDQKPANLIDSTKRDAIELTLRFNQVEYKWEQDAERHSTN